MSEVAIVNGVSTDHKLIAVCEVWTYDVWGNAKDGWEVDDRCCVHRKLDIPAVCTISNLPRYPGARDAYRAYPADVSSFSAEVVISFELTNSAIRDALDIRCRFDVEGDGMRYEVTRRRDGYPMGEILINEWKEC